MEERSCTLVVSTCATWCDAAGCSRLSGAATGGSHQEPATQSADMTDCDMATFGGADGGLGGFDDGAASGKIHYLQALSQNRLEGDDPHMHCRVQVFSALQQWQHHVSSSWQ